MSVSLFKNSSIVTGSIIISSISVYIFQIITARVLGPEDYGIFGALMALLVIFTLPTGAISPAVTKFVSKLNAKEDFNAIGLLRKKLIKDVLIFGSIFLIIIILLSKNIANLLKIKENIPIIIIGITMIFSMLLAINKGIIQGMKRFKVYSLNFIIESFSRLFLLIALLFLGFRVNGAILSYGVAYFIAFLCIFPYIKKTKVKDIYEIKTKKIYRFILIVLITNIFIQLIINLPTLFVKYFYSSELTGYWTAALNLARITLFFVTGISFVMFPEVAEKERKDESKKIFRSALYLALGTSIFMAFLFYLVPNLFIILLYGKEFLKAGEILRWMGIAMIGISILHLYINYRLARIE